MKHLSYDDIVKLFNKNYQLDWHPDFDFQAWKDGKPPLTIIHCSFLGIFKDSNRKEIKQYFIGYKCSDVSCSKCITNSPILEVGPHHIIITRSGLGVSKKIEYVETKKRTLIKEHNNPVFIEHK